MVKDSFHISFERKACQLHIRYYTSLYIPSQMYGTTSIKYFISFKMFWPYYDHSSDNCTINFRYSLYSFDFEIIPINFLSFNTNKFQAWVSSNTFIIRSNESL